MALILPDATRPPPIALAATLDEDGRVLTVEARYNGPPDSGHGGITAGRLAALVPVGSATAVVVRLHAPVPLDTRLATDRQPDGSVLAADGDRLIATARELPGPLPVGAFPRLAATEVARGEQAWTQARTRWDPFPDCYGCGQGRRDGIALRPGLVPGYDVHATSWVPHVPDGIPGQPGGTPGQPGGIPGWLVWGVLDCATAGPVLEAADRTASVLTGELAVAQLGPVAPGHPQVLMSRATGRSGRKIRTEAVLLDPDGAVLALAQATWFIVAKDPTG
ncbi:MAG TPA: hypothetical protein VHM65_09095 [Candidatus Lustribacter sp.]|nr:hypothetical protein [Candidatus Lustribacter sp.]